VSAAHRNIAVTSWREARICAKNIILCAGYYRTRTRKRQRSAELDIAARYFGTTRKCYSRCSVLAGANPSIQRDDWPINNDGATYIYISVGTDNPRTSLSRLTIAPDARVEAVDVTVARNCDGTTTCSSGINGKIG